MIITANKHTLIITYTFWFTVKKLTNFEIDDLLENSVFLFYNPRNKYLNGEPQTLPRITDCLSETKLFAYLVGIPYIVEIYVEVFPIPCVSDCLLWFKLFLPERR